MNGELKIPMELTLALTTRARSINIWEVGAARDVVELLASQWIVFVASSMEIL